MIETGMEEGVPIPRAGQGPATWMDLYELYRGIVVRIPRTATLGQLEPIAEAC